LPSQTHLHKQLVQHQLLFAITNTLAQTVGPTSTAVCHHKHTCTNSWSNINCCLPSQTHLHKQLVQHQLLFAITNTLAQTVGLTSTAVCHHKHTCTNSWSSINCCLPSQTHLHKQLVQHQLLFAITNTLAQTVGPTSAAVCHHKHTCTNSWSNISCCLPSQTVGPTSTAVCHHKHTRTNSWSNINCCLPSQTHSHKQLVQHQLPQPPQRRRTIATMGRTPAVRYFRINKLIL